MMRALDTLGLPPASMAGLSKSAFPMVSRMCGMSQASNYSSTRLTCSGHTSASYLDMSANAFGSSSAHCSAWRRSLVHLQTQSEPCK